MKEFAFRCPIKKLLMKLQLQNSPQHVHDITLVVKYDSYKEYYYKCSHLKYPSRNYPAKDLIFVLIYNNSTLSDLAS